MTGAAPADPPSWHIVTCEYPPEVGGVGDYTLVLAAALAAEGVDTHVWCPSDERAPWPPGEVIVHREFRGFGPASLLRVGRGMDRCRGPRQLFVQWVPHGYGCRSLNLAFAVWLATRAIVKGDRLHVMIHEPFLQFSGNPLRLVAAMIHRLMLTIACAGASRIWLSIPKWADEIRPYVSGNTPVGCLPIPAPPIGEASGTRDDDVRHRLFPGDESVIGHLGTYSPLVTAMLTPALDAVLAASTACVLLVGRGSDAFRSRLLQLRPDLANRVVATGKLPPDQMGRHIRACDVMVQPYPDGISGRRTSSLALLRAGLPVVTNTGWLTEAFWRESGAVALVPDANGTRVGEAAVALLGDRTRRATLSTLALALYDRQFDIRHAVAPLMRAQ